jgi:hypothetical protein
MCHIEGESQPQHRMSCTWWTLTYASHTFMPVGRVLHMTRGFSSSVLMTPNVRFPILVGGMPFSLSVLTLYLVCLTKMCLVL